MAIDYEEAEREIQEYLESLDGDHKLTEMSLNGRETVVFLDVSFTSGDRPSVSSLSETVSELLDAPVNVAEADYDPAEGSYHMELHDVDEDPVPDDPGLN